MAKLGDKPPDADNPIAGLQQQACDQRVLDLLDEIHVFEEFRREQVTLRKLISYLKSALTPREAYAAIEAFGPQLWPASTGAVYLPQATGNDLERVAAWGDATLNKESLALQDCWAIRRSRLHCVRDRSTELLCGHVTQAGESLPSLCVPLIAQSRILGLLHLQCLRDISGVSENGMPADPSPDLALMVAEDLSHALSNMRLRESLLEQSVRDSLTGLFNRRFVEEFLIRELVRAERKMRQLSVIALDIDHFKHINDTFGHGAGDSVLQQIAILLQAHVRGSDVACRIGGEEFLLLLSESTLLIATRRAEGIRNAIHEMSFSYEEKNLGGITASFGAAAYPDHGRTPEALIRAADEALYNAKRAGRNRVVPAAQMPPD